MKIEIITTKNCDPCRELKAWMDKNDIEYTEKSIKDIPRYIFTPEYRNNKFLPHTWRDGVFWFPGKPADNVLKGMFNPKFHKVLNRRFGK